MPGMLAPAYHHCRKFGAIQLARNAGGAQYRDGVACEDETGGLMPVKERPNTEMIPATKKSSAPLVPDGESKVAEQTSGAVLPPFFIGCKDQGCIVDVRKSPGSG